MFLGHGEKNDKDLLGYQIYYHEKNQFWPNENLPSVKRIRLGLQKSASIYFNAWHHTKLSI